MIQNFKFLSDIYKDFVESPRKKIDPQLIKYFKTEFGSSWELELDKYVLKNEEINDQKAA